MSFQKIVFLPFQNKSAFNIYLVSFNMNIVFKRQGKIVWIFKGIVWLRVTWVTGVRFTSLETNHKISLTDLFHCHSPRSSGSVCSSSPAWCHQTAWSEGSRRGRRGRVRWAGVWRPGSGGLPWLEINYTFVHQVFSSIWVGAHVWTTTLLGSYRATDWPTAESPTAGGEREWAPEWEREERHLPGGGGQEHLPPGGTVFSSGN